MGIEKENKRNTETNIFKISSIFKISQCIRPFRDDVFYVYTKNYVATYHDQGKLLNKRSELISKSRHDSKFLLANYSEISQIADIPNSGHAMNSGQNI